MRRFFILCLFPLISTPIYADLDGVNVQLRSTDRLVIQEGKRVYAEECAACHGESLEGQENWKTPDDSGLLPAPPHDDTGHTWHHADDLLFEITKFGLNTILNDDSYETSMPMYEETLSDEDIIAVLSYIKSTWSDQNNDWHNRVNETANKYWEPSEKPLVSKSEIQGQN